MQEKKYSKVLIIAGSDSGGGAGIQADIKTASALGCYAATVITCITAQNTMGVQAVEPLSVDIIRRQMISVLDDIGADAIKIGMLGSPEIAQVVAQELRKYPEIPVVLDPVLVATSGDVLTKIETVETIINDLVPLACVVTPNIDEAKEMTGYSDERSWQVLRERNAQALLLKGGHGIGDRVDDVLYERDSVEIFSHDRIYTNNTHGTGCTLSSAIASNLALGYNLSKAVALSTDYIHQAIRHGATYRLGNGNNPVFHFYKLWK